MSNLKKYAKYIIWLVAFAIFTNFLIFVGFNVNYKKIELRENPSDQIVIDKAEATKSQCRVYGKIINKEINNLNDKYIKISAYNAEGKNVATEYLEVKDLKSNEEKPFRASFKAKEATSYEINIVNK